MCTKLYYLFVIVIAIVQLTKCEIANSKHKFIGDCEWTNRGESNGSLVFICYDHYHKDRFFDYYSDRKPCLNNDQGYIKNAIGDISFRNCGLSKITVDIIEYYRFVWRLNISDIALTSLDKENFNGKHGQTLRILLASYNNLTQIKANLFANAKHVKEADFSFNQIDRIDPMAFIDADELNILNLSGNSLLKLENQIFSNVKNLHTLYLNENKISEIDSLTFAGMTSLSRLDLSFNKITEINAQSSGGASLAHLNLSHNAIGECLLKGLNELHSLDLSYNNMTELNGTMFDNSLVLKVLNVSHNYIKGVDNIGDLSGLIELDVSYNVITNISSYAFTKLANLAVLNLAYNPIKMLNSNPFSMNVNLRHLNLSHTGLMLIKSGTFLKPYKLQSIDLSANNFKKFDFNVFLPRLHELHAIFLDGNKLNDLNGFRRTLFPELRVIGIQNNAFNCSYLRHFFEMIAWHELNIYTDRSGDWNEDNVGGIRCKEINENEQLLTTTASLEIRSETTEEIDESTTLVVNETPYDFDGSATKETVSNEKRSDNLEYLLFALCIILTAFLAVYIILNRDRLFTQIGCSKLNQNNFRSTTTLNTEAAVAYSSCSTNGKF